MIRAVYKFEENNTDYIQFNVKGEYELQDRESFSIEGFYAPTWDSENNTVIEGATQEYVEEKQIESLNAQLDFESGNLLAGALRIVLGENGTLEELKSKVEFLELTYEWAKGETGEAYIDIEAEHVKVLAEENALRDEGKKISIETYKLTHVKIGKEKEALLRTFKEMIGFSLDKVKRLIAYGEIPKAVTAMEMIQAFLKT